MQFDANTNEEIEEKICCNLLNHLGIQTSQTLILTRIYSLKRVGVMENLATGLFDKVFLILFQNDTLDTYLPVREEHHQFVFRAQVAFVVGGLQT